MCTDLPLLLFNEFLHKMFDIFLFVCFFILLFLVNRNHNFHLLKLWVKWTKMDQYYDKIFSKLKGYLLQYRLSTSCISSMAVDDMKEKTDYRRRQ